MTLRTYDLNAGPEGAAATTANSGADLIGTGANGTAVYKAAAAVIGAYGVRLTAVAGNTMTAQWPLDTPNTQCSFSFYIKVPSTAPSSANYVLAQYRQTAGIVCNLVYATNGNIEFWRTASIKEATLLAAASVVATTYYRVTAVINSATGAYSLKIYSGTGTTPLNSISGTASAFASTAAFTDLRLQVGGTGLGALVQDVDSIQINDGSTAEIVPGANAAPSLTVPGNQNVAPGATVSLTAVGADSDGSIASYAWTVLYSSDPAFDNSDLTNAGTATVSLTAPATGHLLVLQCVATDNLGTPSSPKTVEVRVPSSATSVSFLPAASSNVAWTNTGGAATAGDALSDATADTTYIESPAFTSTESEDRLRIRPMTPRTSLSAYNRTAETPSIGGVTKIRLYEGNTLIQEWPITQGTSPADETYTVTTPAAIVDWGNLWLAWAENS